MKYKLMIFIIVSLMFVVGVVVVVDFILVSVSGGIIYFEGKLVNVVCVVSIKFVD